MRTPSHEQEDWTKLIFRRPLAVIAIIAAVGVTGCSNGSATEAGSSASSAALVPVEVQTPTHGEMLAVYSGTAALEADEEATVVAKVGGEVRQILVEEGDTVAAGQVLARLDGDRLRLEVQQSEANLHKLEREYRRNLELIDKGLVAQGAVDNIRFEMEALRAAWELARLELGYTEIRAPIAGVIAARQIKVGNTISAGDATFRVTDLDPLIAYVHVPEREFPRLAAGQLASISVDALGGERFAGRIERVSPIVDAATGTFKATIEVNDERQLLKPGMFARIDVEVDRRRNVLRIPRGALLDEGGSTSVFVVHDGKAEQRPVRTGLSNGGLVEILDGLTGDEQIVVVGQTGLKSGSPVEVVSLKAPARG